jgi:hypothetical protein
MKTWTLTSEPGGVAHQELLEAALVSCVQLRFITFDRWALHPPTTELLDALEPHRIRSEETGEWPGTRLAPGGVARVWVHRYSPDVVRAVLARTEGLGSWGGELPGDPHLLRADGSVWMGSSSSEEDVWLQLSDDEHARVRSLSHLGTLFPSHADAR